MATKIAINGFGRIGRIFFRQAFSTLGGSASGGGDIEIVAINDLGSPENLAYLLKYDSVYRRYDKSFELKDHKLLIEGKEILMLQEKKLN